MAIVQNDKNGRVIMFVQEGVGWLRNIKEEYELPVDIIHEDENSFSIMPIGTIDVKIEDIINTCEYKDMYIRDFIRKFGSRLENNFNEMLRGINEIGLNSNDYYYEKARNKI